MKMDLSQYQNHYSLIWALIWLNNRLNKFFNYISFIIISILFGDSSQIKIDTLEIKKLIDSNIDTKYSIDTLNFYDDWEIIESRIEESKTLLAEAIIADMTGDTLNALFKFEILFESLAGIKIEENINEFYYLEYNKILDASINYYANNAETVNKIETGLSTALLKDKLNQYIYSQTLEDLEYVEETVEIIEGHLPITYNSMFFIRNEMLLHKNT